MTTGRLEAFSDGVIAIIITIMVLELKIPDGADWQALQDMLHPFISYVISFIYVGIYWNNHHHLLQVTEKVNGRVLWANLFLLFALSLIPISTAWIGANAGAVAPTVLYGVVLLGCALGYYILQSVIVAAEGEHSQVKQLIGRDYKGKLSVVTYTVAAVIAFMWPWVANVLYAVMAVVWLIPDKRMEME